MLEAAPEDIELVDGTYRVKGVPATGLTLAEIAKAAYGGSLPEDIDAGLESTDFFKPADETFPFGTHVAVVEVFPETGEVELLRYVSVDDCGNIISPMLVTGQVHGGCRSGYRTGLWEELRYDDNGELLTGTLNDYAMPKADGFPTFETHHTTTTTPINPLGAKGIGEAATIGATPTAANAVIDALSAFGITHLDIPFTPEKSGRRFGTPKPGSMPQTNHAEGMEVVRRMHVSSGSPFEAKIGYSRAVRVGDQVFVSGTTAMQDGGPVAVGDAGAQTRHILDIILRALEEAGATARNVVRYRIYLTNIDDWPAVLEEMSHVFGSVLPTATLVEVKGLINPKSLVEIEVDAIVGITD